MDIEQLPDSVLLTIMSYLEGISLVNCRRVSKRWLALSMEQNIWKRFKANKFVLPSTTQLDAISDKVIQTFIISQPIVREIDLSGCCRVTNRFLLSLSLNCQSLRHLLLEGCNRISDRGILALADSCTTLREINLLDTMVTEVGLTALLQVNPHLGELTVSTTAMSRKSFSALRNCSILEVLHIETSKVMTSYGKTNKKHREVLMDEMLIDLANGCSNLKLITLRFLDSYREISNESLSLLASHCLSLEGLELRFKDSYNCISSGIVDIVNSQKCLQHLSIYDSRATDQLLVQLAKSCPHLKSLSLLGSVFVTDNGMMTLSINCRELELLNISCRENEDGIGDETALVLAKAKSPLQQLSMLYWYITDAGLLAMSKQMPHLKHLSIEGCYDVTHNGLIEALKNWPELLTIDISDTECVSDNIELVAMAKELKSIEKITMHNCYDLDWSGRALLYQTLPLCQAESYSTH